jgi:hypothetical protein
MSPIQPLGPHAERLERLERHRKYIAVTGYESGHCAKGVTEQEESWSVGCELTEPARHTRARGNKDQPGSRDMISGDQVSHHRAPLAPRDVLSPTQRPTR